MTNCCWQTSSHICGLNILSVEPKLNVQVKISWDRNKNNGGLLHLHQALSKKIYLNPGSGEQKSLIVTHRHMAYVLLVKYHCNCRQFCLIGFNYLRFFLLNRGIFIGKKFKTVTMRWQQGKLQLSELSVILCLTQTYTTEIRRVKFSEKNYNFP